MAEQATWTIEEYAAPSGEKPVLKFLLGLEARNKTDAAALLQLLRERGNSLRPPHSKVLGEGLFELRAHEVRIFYIFRPGHRVVLLDGMVKKQNQIPDDVLKRVRAMRRAVEAADRKAREAGR
jgi:phage-related protein